MAEIKFPQRKLTKLKEKGFNLSIPVIEKDPWNILIKKDRSIPRSYAQLKRLSRQLFNAEYRDTVRKTKLAPLPRTGVLLRGYEECGESNYYRFYIGLSNPWLTKKQFLDLICGNFIARRVVAGVTVPWCTFPFGLCVNIVLPFQYNPFHNRDLRSCHSHFKDI